MRDKGEIVSFLDRVGVQVSETGLYIIKGQKTTYTTSTKNITVITVQTTSLLGHRTGSNVNNTGKKFTRNLKPTNHKKQKMKKRTYLGS